MHEKENIKHGGIIFDRYGELKPGSVYESSLYCECHLPFMMLCSLASTLGNCVDELLLTSDGIVGNRV